MAWFSGWNYIAIGRILSFAVVDIYCLSHYRYAEQEGHFRLLWFQAPWKKTPISNHRLQIGCQRVAWQFQTPICFPAVKQGSILELRSWKKHLSDLAWWQRAIRCIYYLFTNKWRAETLQLGLEFHNFKPRLTTDGIFKCISWLNGSFLGWYWGFLKEAVKTYLVAPMSPLNSSTFFCLHIYSLCFQLTQYNIYIRVIFSWKIVFKVTGLVLFTEKL